MEVLTVMQKVHYATKHQVSRLMLQWAEGASRINNTDKKLKDEVIKGNLIKVNNFYKLAHLEGNHPPHSQALTDALIDILLVNPDTDIYRERKTELALIPDAIVILKKNNLVKCLLVEAMNTEDDPTYKVNLWKTHPDSLRILSEITGIEIENIEIAVVGKEAPKGTIPLTTILEDL